MKTALFFCVFSALVAPQWATPGGVEKIDDLGSEEVLAAAQAAVDRLNQGSNSLYEMLLVEVLDGTQQVVAGKNYVLTILVGMSDCRKDEDRESTGSCHISGTSTWTATVFYHPWYSPKYEVTDLEMVKLGGREKEQQEEDHMAGAPVPLQDLHDESVLAAAEAVVSELNKKSNAIFKTVLVEILDGTSQVVNGVKYSLTLLVGRSSTCRNDGVPATLEQCPAKLDTMEKWEAEVWQHSTSSQYDILALDKLP